MTHPVYERLSIGREIAHTEKCFEILLKSIEEHYNYLVEIGVFIEEGLQSVVEEQPKWSGPEDGLPPVGTVCEAAEHEGDTHSEVEIKLYDEDEVVVKRGKDGLYILNLPSAVFRPIKTERERVIEKMIKDLGANIYVNDRSFAEVFYDAGYRLTEGER